MPRYVLIQVLFLGTVLIALGGKTLASDLFGYVSENELDMEIGRRKTDIDRTEQRMADLELLEKQLQGKTLVAEEEVARMNEIVISRTRLFYRLSKSGGSLRYLMGSTSATLFLKRLAELRYLLRSALESQRQSNLKLTKIKTELSEIEAEKESSEEILSQLNQALGELLEEQLRRKGDGKVPIRYRSDL